VGTPYRDGTTQVAFDQGGHPPVDFIARLAALVPKPRVKRTGTPSPATDTTTPRTTRHNVSFRQDGFCQYIDRSMEAVGRIRTLGSSWIKDWHGHLLPRACYHAPEYLLRVMSDKDLSIELGERDFKPLIAISSLLQENHQLPERHFPPTPRLFFLYLTANGTVIEVC
jgi:hypothetical protein